MPPLRAGELKSHLQRVNSKAKLLIPSRIGAYTERRARRSVPLGILGCSGLYQTIVRIVMFRTYLGVPSGTKGHFVFIFFPVMSLALMMPKTTFQLKMRVLVQYDWVGAGSPYIEGEQDPYNYVQ